jgi:hypothetical protein
MFLTNVVAGLTKKRAETKTNSHAGRISHAGHLDKSSAVRFVLPLKPLSERSMHVTREGNIYC